MMVATFSRFYPAPGPRFIFRRTTVEPVCRSRLPAPVRVDQAGPRRSRCVERRLGSGVVFANCHRIGTIRIRR
jgi:hypothetical protein